MNNFIHDKIKAKKSSKMMYNYSCATYSVVIHTNKDVVISLLPEHPEFLNKNYIYFHYIIEGRIYNTIMDHCGGNANKVIIRRVYK